ncbi:hypothetical protein [Glycomyces sp. YM15]|uniref:hypothetical protein n=1 Tax=Glycomyces sp. YM15 TaxID=2800446 RepID=UPI0019647ED9|nr:hypothetical protein [Glycomyces sp. YM15]
MIDTPLHPHPGLVREVNAKATFPAAPAAAGTDLGRFTWCGRDFAVTGHTGLLTVKHCSRNGDRTNVAIATPSPAGLDLAYLCTGLDLGVTSGAESTFRNGLRQRVTALADHCFQGLPIPAALGITPARSLPEWTS